MAGDPTDESPNFREKTDWALVGVKKRTNTRARKMARMRPCLASGDGDYRPDYV